MKAPTFQYFCPESLEEALDLLGRFGDDAQLLAGGQSLVPMMNMRLAAPTALIDINHIPELRGIDDHDSIVRVGAATRYFEVPQSALLREYVPLLPLAVPLIAHVAIRNRGTLGGSISLSDPAAELPACCVVLDATFVLASRAGRREVQAEAFALGLYETVRKPDEILVEILFPKAKPNERHFIDEFSRRRGDFAIVGLAGKFEVGNGMINAPRLAFFGCETHSVLAKKTASIVEGNVWNSKVASAAAVALKDELRPIDSVHASSSYRHKVAQVLLGRAVSRAVEQVPH